MMDDANLDYIEVFKAGKHTDSSGDTREWTENDLSMIESIYNNQPESEKHRAPAVAGSHISDGPAYGWVSNVKKVGKKLLAKFEQVDEGFKNLVNAGRFGTVSIALYPDLKLRHVAFLGAMPPAVKGLKTPQFNDKKGNFFSIDMKTEDSVVDKWSNVKDDLVSSLGQEIGDKAYNEAKKYLENVTDNNELNTRVINLLQVLKTIIPDGKAVDTLSRITYTLGVRIKDGKYSFSESSIALQKKRADAIKAFAEERNNRGKTQTDILANQHKLSDHERAFAEMEAKQRGVSFSEVLNKPKSEMQKFIEERNKRRV